MAADASHHAFRVCICIYRRLFSISCAKKADGVCCFFILISMAIYTFKEKNLGLASSTKHCGTKEIILGIFFGALIGFYDGVFGPGSGSFLLFIFVKFFGLDFLNASASAKLVNLGTFIAALTFLFHLVTSCGLSAA